MKILYIHQYFKTPDEAGGNRSYEFAKYLVGKGHDLIMLAGKNNAKKIIEHKTMDGIRVIYIKNQYSNYMSFRRRVLSFLSFAFWSSLESLKNKDVDLIFVTSTPLTIAIPGLVINFVRHTPFVFEVRDLWPDVPVKLGIIKNRFVVKFLYWFEKLVYKKATKIVALSPGIRDGIIGKGISPDKVVLIPNASDTHRFIIHQKVEKDLLSKYNITRDSFIVIYTGAIAYANDLKVVVEACKLLQFKLKSNSIVVVIAGDGKEKPFLEGLKDRYELKNLLFIGEIPKTEVVDLISLSHSGLLVFKSDPIFETNSPNKFFDYIAARKPIISNVGGWTKEIIEKNRLGLVVSAGDSEALAYAMLKMSNISLNEIREMGLRSRKVAEEYFSCTKLAEKLEAVLLGSFEET